MSTRIGMIVVVAGLLHACRGDDASPPVEARVSEPQSLAARIDSIAEQALRDGPVAGLSIAVFRGSEAVFAKGYGFANVEAGIPATEDTKYDIASVSKLFTALAVMKLVEEGKLGLDDDLGTLLPAFPNPEQARRVTLRQLLNHTSGLSDYLPADLVRMQQAEKSPSPLSPSFVLDYLAERRLDFDPGREWRYDNSGFYLAALVIEQVTGQPWGDYVRETIARPLGLHDTLSCGDLRPDRRSQGYESTDSGFDGTSVYAELLYAEAGVQGDGGLCSSVRDLAHLPAALAEQPLIPDARLAELLRPTVLTDGVTIDYGLGVRLGNLEGHPVWGHTGSVLLAYSSTLAHYPDDDLTIAVLMNTIDATTDALVIEGVVAREVLGLEDSVSGGQTLSHAASTYTGEYVGDRYYDLQAILDGVITDARQTFRIVEDDGHLERIVLTGDTRPSLELIYNGDRSFGRADWPMDSFVFHVQDSRARGYSEYYNGIFATFNRRVEP